MIAGDRARITAMLRRGVSAEEITRALIVPIQDVREVQHELRGTSHPDLTKARQEPFVPRSAAPAAAATPETPAMTVTSIEQNAPAADVFARAERIDDPRIAKALARAVAARDALAELVERHEAEADARARIAELEAQLEAERAKLRRPQPTSSHSAIRAWAVAAGHTVPEKGPVPREIRDRYHAAHGTTPAAS